MALTGALVGNASAQRAPPNHRIGNEHTGNLQAYGSWENAIALTFRQARSVELGPLLVMFGFVFAGFSVLFRSIEVDREGVTKKFLWSRRRIPWSEADGIVRFKDGTYAVAGESQFGL